MLLHHSLALYLQVSGLKKRDKLAPGQSAARGPQVDDGDNVDSEQMLAE